jgi:hypothetical protein
MNRYTVRVDRVVLHGLAQDEHQARRLSAAIAEELGRVLSDGPLPAAHGDASLAVGDVRVDIPAFALESPGGEQRAAHHAAHAIAAAVRGRDHA